MQTGPFQPQASQPDERDAASPAVAAISGALLEDVVITDELTRRTARPPDYRAEAETLGELTDALARSPETVFQKLADRALQLCRAQSAGISLAEQIDGRKMALWRATAGAFAPLEGGLLTGDLIESGEVKLLKQPARAHPALSKLGPEIHELLLLPIQRGDELVGTLWIAAHDDGTHFDAEDARLARRLSQFVAAAARAEDERTDAEETHRQLRTREQELIRIHELARRTDARFHAFFEQAPFYTGILSIEGRVSEVGKMALEVCGYTREEIVGKLFWETSWWRSSEEIQEQIHAAFDAALTGKTFQATLPYLMADGAERWVDFGLSPVFDEGGAVPFVIATGTDITARTQTEVELVKVRKRLDSALLAAEIGTYEWDVTSDRLYGDRNFVQIFGVPVDAEGSAPLGSFLAATHAGDRERITESIQHSVATGENFEEDYRVVLPQGERWVNSRGRMIKDANGRVVNFFGVVRNITERKRVERERETIADRLRRLTAIHETVLSATNDFAYVFDLEGKFLYANRPLLALFARSLDQVVGRTFYELGYPTWHADMHMREIAHVIATKQPIRGEVAFTGESGISGVYDYIFTPVFGTNGRIEAVAGTTRDVSDRKRGEVRDRLLIALDDATRHLTDPQAVMQTSAQMLGEHLRVNRCAYADVEADENTFNLTGDYVHEVPSIVGRYRFDQFGEDCLERMRAGVPFLVSDSETDARTAAVLESYRATQIRSVICVPLQKSGRFVAAMAVHQAEPRQWLHSEVELVQRVASRCWESIERTRVVRILADSEQRLRLAVETGRLGVWELELPARIFTASPQCKAIYGRAPDRPFPYEEILSAVHAEDQERVQAAVKRSIADGHEYDIEYRTVWPDGSVHWVLVRGQTSPGADGKSQRMIGVSLDITARKEAESEQIRLREEAVRASRAKDDFLATLSHELRTPLNPVLLLASDGAHDLRLTQEIRSSFETIRKNVELEARLIDDLLDLTTIARGKLAIRKEVHALHTILDDAVAAVRSDFTDKAITLTVKLGGQKPAVFADDVRLLQVFINLLKNAAKFTPPGGTVTLDTVEAGENQIAVRLADTGIGMTQPELQRAFGAFEQGDHATELGSHRFGGLGLGLAISHRLVEMHGGTIEATSAGRDRGTVFTVTLPLHVRAAADQATRNAPPLTRTPEPSLDGLRILLVEDHEPTRRTLDELLRRRNFTVVCAGSLGEAREAAGTSQLDFVISDLGLPDGDGTTLMAELRDRFGLRGIALTGYGMVEDIARCRAAGFVAHLTKPIRVEALEAVLREYAETFRGQN